ncbi:hypothetical protein QBC43DRAFT_358029 [Cladorrhinum sp. PSN259]|nr:hypothetical protein QBC43DRAFT_358029 [Cladorrhinum sp. PSN259]
MKFSTLTAAASSLLGITMLPGASGTPTAAGLTHLGTANLTIGTTVPIGAGPRGDRNFYPVVGGSFSGPAISGTVFPSGGDWGLGDQTAGQFYVDARFILHTADGANIYIEANGPQQPDGTFYTRIKLETGNETYYWLNGVVAVGVTTIDPSFQFLISEFWRLEVL